MSRPRDGKKTETAFEYLASLVVAMLSATKRQIISDGAIRVGEMHDAGPVPDEGGCSTELEGKWGVDGIWIDLRLLKQEKGIHEEFGCFGSCQ